MFLNPLHQGEMVSENFGLTVTDSKTPFAPADSIVRRLKH